ncbi:MAG: lysostaphin resistance A-like protein [Propioniciclava sp.]
MVAALGFYVVSILGAVTVLTVVLPQADMMVADDFFDMARPLPLAIGLGLIAVMLPAALLAVGVVGKRPAGTLASVAGRMRWPVLGRGMLIALGTLAVSLGIQLVLPFFPAAPVAAVRDPLWLMLLIPLLLAPLQSAAEEYVFRGMIPQVLGVWVASPWIAYGLPVVGFTLGHIYDPAGLIAVAGFGIAASWLTWRSGGIELAVALHVVNNTVLFGLSAFGLVDPNATVIPVPSAVLDVAVTVLSTLVMMRWVIRPMGLRPS